MYHVFWILNVIEVLYLAMLTFSHANPWYIVLNFFFNVVAMLVSYIYAEYYHEWYGKNLATKIIIGLFIILSFVAFIALNVLIVLSVTNRETVEMSQADAIINEVLILVPLTHSVILLYIW